jgi:hypothetical protein
MRGAGFGAICVAKVEFDWLYMCDNGQQKGQLLGGLTENSSQFGIYREVAKSQAKSGDKHLRKGRIRLR